MQRQKQSRREDLPPLTGPDGPELPAASGAEEQDRRQLQSDHVQGLYLVTSVLHCALSDLGGKQPEQGMRIAINDEEGGGGFFRQFYVASSTCEMGMLRVELEAIGE